jgi:hypothetical protein
MGHLLIVVYLEIYKHFFKNSRLHFLLTQSNSLFLTKDPKNLLKVFITNMNIPKSALFLELGWEPINDYLDRQRVSYFARIKKLTITRL